MTKRVVLATYGERVRSMVRLTDGVRIDDSYPAGGNDVLRLTEAEARHLRDWLCQQFGLPPETCTHGNVNGCSCWYGDADE